MRRVLQGVILVLGLYVALVGGDVERYCPAGGLASFSGQLVNGRMSCSMSAVNIFLFLAAALGVVLMGRLFCAFVCPLGTVSEALGVAGKRLGLARVLRGRTDQVLRSLKFVLLFFVLFETFKASELFCKKFDPWFAVAGGFQHESWLPGALTALVILVLGALAGRLVWCKYLCFFGAAQSSVATLVGVLGGAVYLGSAALAGGRADMAWLFGVVCVGGYVGELLGQRVLPLVKVERRPSACTSCRACDRACPHGILVSEAEAAVTHPDCFVCGDCVAACRVPGALGWRPFGASWLGPVLVVLLVSAGLVATGVWGDQAAFATVRYVPDGLVVDGTTVAALTQHGVKSIKCWGSSMSFVYRLGRRGKDGAPVFRDGVLGAETFAATNTYRVFYDPRKLDETTLRGLIFSAGKTCIRPVSSVDPATTPAVGRWQVGVYGVVDDWDIIALGRRLGADPAVLAFETVFGEPVAVTVYHVPGATEPSRMAAAVADPTPLDLGGKVLPFRFTPDGAGTVLEPQATDLFRAAFFPAFDRRIAQVEGVGAPTVLEAGLAGLDDPANAWPVSWLGLHLAPLDGLLRLRGVWRDGPRLLVDVVPGTLTPERLAQALRSPVLTWRRGEVVTEKPNPFVLKGEVRVLPD